MRVRKRARDILGLVAAASEAVALSGLPSRSPSDLETSNHDAEQPGPRRHRIDPLAGGVLAGRADNRLAGRVHPRRGGARSEGQGFSDDDESVLTLLAQMASVALQNAQLYADVRSNERRLQAVVESSPLAIAELDLSGDARWWNRAAGELFGWIDSDGPRQADGA